MCSDGGTTVHSAGSPGGRGRLALILGDPATTGHVSCGREPRGAEEVARTLGPYATSRDLSSRRTRIPLAERLREGSSYHRGHLKRRLFEEGYKERACESCGQGEVWRGRQMALILDHINGVRNDNRLENLRILCPNCAATLDTHCGRKNRLLPRRCLRCDREFQPADGRQRYCCASVGFDGIGLISACRDRRSGGRIGPATPSSRPISRR
jgi:hypothetical protein